MIKYKVVYAYESLSNFPNHEHETLFNTVQEAFTWINTNQLEDNIYIVEEVEV